MMNIQDITSRLAMMPDQQLTQYAAMNRTDPYVLSLAMSEHNRRKQMRTAAQGAMMGQTPPPPVVDQLLQQMEFGVDTVIPDTLWNMYKNTLDDFLLAREELTKYLQDNDAGY